MSASVRLSGVVPAFEPETAVARLGMIVLATDLTSECDAARVLPQDGVALHVSRVAYENPTTPENLRKMGPRLTDAARLLAPVPDLRAVWYSCTAASVEIGDAAVTTAIEAALPGMPVVTPPEAALQGFAALRVQRIALVTPYLVETTEPMAAYFTRGGLDLVGAQCLGLSDDRDMARVTSETIIAAAMAADHPKAEGIFISCTALPALGVIAEIEGRLGKPVISSNQASLWRMAHHAGLSARLHGVGHLFDVTPLDDAA